MGSCFCVGPQRGEKLCPCALRASRDYRIGTHISDKYKRTHEKGAEIYDITRQEAQVQTFKPLYGSGEIQMDMVVLTRGEAGFVLDILNELKDLDEAPTAETEEAITLLSSAIDNTLNIAIIPDEEEDADTDNIGNRR